jgi:hypothetical protein
MNLGAFVDAFADFVAFFFVTGGIIPKEIESREAKQSPI